MEQDGHLKSLAERMKEKAEQERIQTESVFREQLQTLKDNLLASSQNALRTMSDAMAQEITNASASLTRHYKILSMAYGKAWIRTAITALAALIPLALVVLLLAGWMKYQIDSYHSTCDRLEARIAEQRQTLANLNAGTWGVTLRETEHGRFVIMPPGVSPSQKVFMVDMLKAIRLER